MGKLYGVWIRLDKAVKIFNKKRKKEKSEESLREPITHLSLARGERQLWHGWSRLPRDSHPAANWQQSTEATEGLGPNAARAKRKPEGLGCLPNAVSSRCVGKRLGRRLGKRLGRKKRKRVGRRLGRRLDGRANDVQNLASCTATVWNKAGTVWKQSQLGLTTLATIQQSLAAISWHGCVTSIHHPL